MTNTRQASTTGRNSVSSEDRKWASGGEGVAALIADMASPVVYGYLADI